MRVAALASAPTGAHGGGGGGGVTGGGLGAENAAHGGADASHHARALQGVKSIHPARGESQFALQGSSFQKSTAVLQEGATPASSLASQGLADVGGGAMNEAALQSEVALQSDAALQSEAALQSSVRRAALDSALSTLARFEEAMGIADAGGGAGAGGADSTFPARSEHPTAPSDLRNQASSGDLRNQAGSGDLRNQGQEASLRKPESLEAEERLLGILWVT